MRNLLLRFCGAALYAGAASAQSTVAGLLPIDQAYQVSAEIKSPGVVTVRWTIADDYYLYRERMNFTAGKDTKLGAAKLPDGAKFHDEFSGDMEIYHHNLEATIPYTAAPGATSIHLSVGYQGCHETDPKLCYPPHTKALDVALSRGAASTGGPTAAPSKDTAKSSLTGAARYSGTPEAKAAAEEAETAKKAGNIEDSIKGYKKAITLDPNFASAQTEYLIFQRSRNMFGLLYHPTQMSKEERAKAEKAALDKDKVLEKQLIAEYTAAIKKHPDQAIYPWALGLLYNESDLAREESLCKQAVQIDQSFPQGWECLATVTALRSAESEALPYMRKAFELAPDDSEIAGNYAYMLGLSSNGKGDESEIRSLLQRFPDSYPIAITLTKYANELKQESARIAALEKLRKDAPDTSKPAAIFAGEYLYAIYIASDLPKARNLANDMAGPKKENKQWAARATYVDALIKAQTDIDAHHVDSALGILKSVEGQKDADPGKTWYLLQARALDSGGKTAEAFALLRNNFAAEPTDAVQAALRSYGTKLGKSETQIAGDVWTVLKATGKPAIPFTLKRLDDNKPLSLSDYRGKVVIVDFWYPNCGPCRAAFPYLQQLATKYKDQGLSVLAINGIEEQQDFALPYLRSKGLDFIGLRGNEKFAQDVYGVKGYPSTFLIGADGKVYMHPNLYDEAHERSAELTVEILLRQASGHL